MTTAAPSKLHGLACGAMIVFIGFTLAHELFLAPLRPGGSLLALKALPFVLALPGLYKRRLYTLQWTALLVLAYIAFAIVAGMTDAAPRARVAGWIEAGLGLVYFVAALAVLRPYKQAHQARRRARAGDSVR